MKNIKLQCNGKEGHLSGGEIKCKKGCNNCTDESCDCRCHRCDNDENKPDV